jgi:hypothetical protein
MLTSFQTHSSILTTCVLLTAKSNSTQSKFQAEVSCNLFTYPPHLTDAEMCVILGVNIKRCTNTSSTPSVFYHNVVLIKFWEGVIHFTWTPTMLHSGRSTMRSLWSIMFTKLHYRWHISNFKYVVQVSQHDLSGIRGGGKFNKAQGTPPFSKCVAVRQHTKLLLCSFRCSKQRTGSRDYNKFSVIQQNHILVSTNICCLQMILAENVQLWTPQRLSFLPRQSKFFNSNHYVQDTVGRSVAIYTYFFIPIYCTYEILDVVPIHFYSVMFSKTYAFYVC